MLLFVFCSGYLQLVFIEIVQNNANTQVVYISMKKLQNPIKLDLYVYFFR